MSLSPFHREGNGVTENQSNLPTSDSEDPSPGCPLSLTEGKGSPGVTQHSHGELWGLQVTHMKTGLARERGKEKLLNFPRTSDWPQRQNHFLRIPCGSCLLTGFQLGPPKSTQLQNPLLGHQGTPCTSCLCSLGGPLLHWVPLSFGILSRARVFLVDVRMPVAQKALLLACWSWRNELW